MAETNGFPVIFPVANLPRVAKWRPHSPRHRVRTVQEDDPFSYLEAVESSALRQLVTFPLTFLIFPSTLGFLPPSRG